MGFLGLFLRFILSGDFFEIGDLELENPPEDEFLMILGGGDLKSCAFTPISLLRPPILPDVKFGAISLGELACRGDLFSTVLAEAYLCAAPDRLLETFLL